MPSPDTIATEVLSTSVPRQRPSAAILAIAVLAGILAALFLVLGAVLLVDWHITVNADLAFDLIGRHVIAVHRVGGGLLLFISGTWFAVLTRGLWRRRRYGRIMGWITLGVLVVIAILLAVS